MLARFRRCYLHIYVNFFSCKMTDNCACDEAKVLSGVVKCKDSGCSDLNRETYSRDLEDVDTGGVRLPPKPEEPAPGDCCGDGCVTCVLDVYQQELQKWEEECNRIKLGLPSVSTPLQRTELLDKLEYTAFPLESITELTPDSNIYRFKLPQNTTLGLTPGQHLILRVTTSSSRLTRPYTPVSLPAAAGYFDVLIKNYSDGRLTKNVKDWKTGDLIEWRGPFGELKYKANSYSRVLLLAAGTGIAPMIQLIRHIVDNDQDDTFVRLLYACKTYDDVLMKTQLIEWTRNWNFTVLYALSQEDENHQPVIRYGDIVQYGAITDKNISSELAGHINDCLVLICGTKAFDQAMIKYVKETGVPHCNVFKF